MGAVVMEAESNPKGIVDELVTAFNRVEFKGLPSRLGASQNYLIAELQKIGEEKYYIAEERVQKTDIVFLEQETRRPIIALEYEQSGRYLETIQKMKRVSDSPEGRSLKALVFSFWYEDAEGRLKLLSKIRSDLKACSVGNDKVWMMVGLSFPHLPSFKREDLFVSKASVAANAFARDGKKNLRIPQYCYNGRHIEAYHKGKVIFSEISEPAICVPFCKSAYISEEK